MKAKITRYLIPLLILTIIITFCSFSCSPPGPGNQTIEETAQETTEEITVEEPEEEPAEEVTGEAEEEAEEQEELKKFYPPAIEDILLFMYRRAGRYKWQTTFNFLKGKILNFRDEEVKEGFNWLKKRSNYIDNVSSSSIKVNDNGIQLLKSLNKM